MSESFKEISDRLLNSSKYQGIDEVNDDIKRLVSHYEKLQAENAELKRKLDLAIEALSGLIFHCVDINQGEDLFILAMEIEKADQALKEIKEI